MAAELRNNPAMRLSEVAEQSGFANEKTFLRVFKASCGLTPSEWKQEQNNGWKENVTI